MHESERDRGFWGAKRWEGRVRETLRERGGGGAKERTERDPLRFNGEEGYWA